MLNLDSRSFGSGSAVYGLRADPDGRLLRNEGAVGANRITSTTRTARERRCRAVLRPGEGCRGWGAPRWSSSAGCRRCRRCRRCRPCRRGMAIRTGGAPLALVGRHCQPEPVTGHSFRHRRTAVRHLGAAPEPEPVSGHSFRLRPPDAGVRAATDPRCCGACSCRPPTPACVQLPTPTLGCASRSAAPPRVAPCGVGGGGHDRSLTPRMTRYSAGNSTTGPPDGSSRSNSAVRSAWNAGQRPSLSASCRAAAKGPNRVV